MNITAVSSAEAEKNQRALGCTTHVPFQSTYQPEDASCCKCCYATRIHPGGKRFLLISILSMPQR